MAASRTSRPAQVAGALPGAVLGAASALAGALRRDKALHPVGHRGSGRLEVTDPDPAWGIPALATASTLDCDLRWSRSMGLPGGLPDVEGLAVRLMGAGRGGGDADLLFASTGTSAWSRFVLVPRPQGRFGSMTTLLPVRAGGWAVIFRVTPASPAEDDGDLPPATYALALARGRSAWHTVGRLDVTWRRDDRSERFDPVTRQLASTEQFAFVTTLREPAYAAARAVARARARRT